MWLAITSAATSTGIAAVYSVRNALPADAEQLDRRRLSGDRVRAHCRASAQSDTAAGSGPARPARDDGRIVLHAASCGDLLWAPRGAATRRARNVLAGVAQRGRAPLVGRAGGGCGRGVDVGQSL